MCVAVDDASSGPATWHLMRVGMRKTVGFLCSDAHAPRHTIQRAIPHTIELSCGKASAHHEDDAHGKSR